jgi:NhaA family Na+:H+ antiporter
LALQKSGIHATITGVIFGLITPTRSSIGKKTLGPVVERTLCFLKGEAWNMPRSERYVLLRQMEIAAQKSISPLERYLTELHPWVGFVIMPIFALANAGFVVELTHISQPVALAVMAGLFFGKPIGIVTFSWIAVKLDIAKLPERVSWTAMIGSGFLGGIGFTMALFIGGLAFEGKLLVAAKIGILIGSVLSATVGMIILQATLPQQAAEDR